MRRITIKLLGLSLFILWLLYPYQCRQEFLSAALDNSLNTNETALLYYNKDADTCIDKLRQLIDSSPDNIAAKENLIQVCHETGKYDEAIAQLKVLLNQEPANRKYRSALIKTAFLAGRWTESVNLSETADLSAGELYWRGLALAELGRDREAIDVLNASLSQEPFNPMANYKLGQLYQTAGDYDSALQFYRKAAAQEPNLTAVYFPLAKVYIALKKYQSAYHLLLNAKSTYPWSQEIKDTLGQFLAEHPELLQQQQLESKKRRQIIVAPEVVPVNQAREKIPEIRIGLAEKIRKFYLKTGDRFRLQAGTKSYQGEAQSVLFIKQSANRIEIRDNQDKLLITENCPMILAYDNPAATTILFDVEYGGGTFWAGRQDRVYRGYFRFILKNEGITIVNHLNMEEYLYGVVPSEMEPTWPAAALEAQAVAARTYAVSNMKAYDSRGFDLLPTVASQVYSGVTAEKPSTNAAVDATRGQIVVYNGKPINAFYTGNNGGYSNNCRDVWGMSLPYLQAVPDKLLPPRTEPLSPANLAEWLITRPPTYSSHPQYSGRSSYRWTLWVSRQEIENRLKPGGNLGRILSVTVTGRSANGLVTKVLVKGTGGDYTVTNDSIRSRLGGLRSNMFIVEPKMGPDGLPECFIFYGGGWGHGVGMCQSGAAGMAADGYKCQEILKHYYQGVELSKAY